MEHCTFPWWQVLVAAFAYFSLGAVWYNPKVFGAKWAVAHGIKTPTEEEKNAKKGMMVKSMTIGFFIVLFQTAIICCVCCMSAGMCAGGELAGACTSDAGCCTSSMLLHCAGIGAMLGFGFALAQALGFNYLEKPLNAYLIDGGYSIVGSTLACVILGLLGAC